MRLLGAVLAGGRSSRFGSDKAEAMLAGRPLLDHVAGALGRMCDAAVVCGREWPGLAAVADRPPGRGPLGGIAAALAHAEANGFDLVLTAPCDTPRLPDGLIGLLEPAPAYLEDCPVIGLWPASARAGLDAHLRDPGAGAVRRWADAIGAGGRAPGVRVANVNRPGDLAGLR